MKKIGSIIAFLVSFIATADIFTPTMVPGGTGGWTVVSGNGLQLGLRARDQGMTAAPDKKGAYPVHQGSCVLEFSIGSNQTLAPLEPSNGYFKFYLRSEGSKGTTVEPLFNWNDNYFMAPDGNVFQGPASWYVVVSSLAQGSHPPSISGKHTLYAVPIGGVLRVRQVSIDVKFVK